MKRENSNRRDVKTVTVNSLAALVTGGLFLTMSGLVAMDDTKIYISPETTILKGVLFRPEEDEAKRSPIVVETPPEIIDTPEPYPRLPNGPTSPTDIFVPPHQPTGVGPVEKPNLTDMDGDMMIIAGFPPRYPSRQARSGVEGYVIISLTVNADGRVEDPYVIEADPIGVFDKAALTAMAKFKYKPRVINGQALPVHNVLYKMSFELEE